LQQALACFGAHIRVVRIGAYLTDKKAAKTPISRFAALAPVGLVS